jgi:S1-C subfamily serine protease
LTLRVRNREGVRDVSVTARPAVSPTEPPHDAQLGLRLRTIPKVGVQVLSVQPLSSGARAAIREGDVITVVDGRRSPTSTQITRAFASLPSGGSLLVAVMRGNEHRVSAIEK